MCNKQIDTINDINQIVHEFNNYFSQTSDKLYRKIKVPENNLLLHLEKINTNPYPIFIHPIEEERKFQVTETFSKIQKITNMTVLAIR